LEPERLLLAGDRLRRSLRLKGRPPTDLALLEAPKLFLDPHLALETLRETLRLFVDVLRFMLLVTLRLLVVRCAGRPLFAWAILWRFAGLLFFEAFFELSVFFTAEDLTPMRVFFDGFGEDFTGTSSNGILYMSFCLSDNALHSSPALFV